MLTSYLVRCPEPTCRWSGSLIPRATPQTWRGTPPANTEVAFQCPQCQTEWRMRKVGDDVRPLPLAATK
jgi:hypothetical protein